MFWSAATVLWTVEISCFRLVIIQMLPDRHQHAWGIKLVMGVLYSYTLPRSSWTETIKWLKLVVVDFFSSRNTSAAHGDNKSASETCYTVDWFSIVIILMRRSTATAAVAICPCIQSSSSATACDYSISVEHSYVYRMHFITPKSRYVEYSF